MITFKQWLFSEETKGYSKILKWKQIVHLFIGLAVTYLTKTTIEQALTQEIILPVLGIMIGLTITWAGNATNLITTDTAILLARRHENGFQDWIFTFQLSILVTLITTIYWILISLNIDINILRKILLETGIETESIENLKASYHFARTTIAFTLISVTIHEGWSCINGTTHLASAFNQFKELDFTKRVQLVNAVYIIDKNGKKIDVTLDVKKSLKTNNYYLSSDKITLNMIQLIRYAEFNQDDVHHMVVDLSIKKEIYTYNLTFENPNLEIKIG